MSLSAICARVNRSSGIDGRAMDIWTAQSICDTWTRNPGTILRANVSALATWKNVSGICQILDLALIKSYG